MSEISSNESAEQLNKDEGNESTSPSIEMSLDKTTEERTGADAKVKFD